MLIPAANKENLMLKKELLEAVKQDLFHIYAARTIDDGIELLTDTPAGALNNKGEFPEESIHFKVNQRIDALNRNLKKYAHPGDRV